jgi:hypothetical protein
LRQARGVGDGGGRGFGYLIARRKLNEGYLNIGSRCLHLAMGYVDELNQYLAGQPSVAFCAGYQCLRLGFPNRLVGRVGIHQYVGIKKGVSAH